MPDQIQPDDTGPSIQSTFGNFQAYMDAVTSMESFYMPTYGNKVKIVKEKVYILDDVDPSELDRLKKINHMGRDRKELKKQNVEEVIELSKEEKDKATVRNLAHYLLDKFRGPDYGRSFKFAQIGKIVYGRFVRGSKEWNSGIVLGHVIAGKLCKTNTESYLAVARGANLQGASYIIYNLDKKAIQVYEKVWFDMTSASVDTDQENKILTKLNYTILDGELSGRVFGFAPSKKELVGTKPERLVFEVGESLKLGTTTHYAIIYHPGRDKNLKFCIADLQLTLPSLVGYNLPKDKTLRLGDTVVIKGSENKELFKIAQVVKHDTSKRLCKNSINRQLDIVTLVNLETGNQVKQYAKNLKVIV